MKINDGTKRRLYIEVEEGEVFRYYDSDSAGGPFYCIKTESYYEDGKTVVNAVDLQTGELFYIEANEEVNIITAELTIK